MSESGESLPPWQRWRAAIVYQLFLVWVWIRALGMDGGPPSSGGWLLAAAMQLLWVIWAVTILRASRRRRESH